MLLGLWANLVENNAYIYQKPIVFEYRAKFGCASMCFLPFGPWRSHKLKVELSPPLEASGTEYFNDFNSPSGSYFLGLEKRKVSFVESSIPNLTLRYFKN